MHLSEWKHIWDLAVALLGREPAEWRVAVMLAAAFTTLMVVEGLRASFLPQRTRNETMQAATAPRPAPRAAAEQSTVSPSAAPVVTSERTPAPRSTAFATSRNGATQHLRRPARGAMPHNRKREAAKPRAQRDIRPKIRRRMVSAQVQNSESALS